jgi:MraZ protein
MALEGKLILGEHVRAMDERYRLGLPPELVTALSVTPEKSLKIAKERHGSLSLWNLHTWRERIDSGISLVTQKFESGRLSNRVAEVQQFGRLLSARYRDVNLSDSGRLVIPEGFREFLGVQPKGDCVVVGAGVCVELWHPDAWREYLKEELTGFAPLFDQLSS